MKITSIRQQIKNPERVSVFIDERYEFSLSLDELVKYKLKNGQELDKADVKKFKKISADGKLRGRSLEWLLNRPHSEREFREYLYKKTAEPEQINSLVSEFTNKGYLDNAKFAIWFVELQSRRGKSNRAIAAGLYKKGIAKDIIEESLIGDTNDEQARLQQMIDKKSKLSRYKNDPQKLAQYLVAQGYNWQDVKSALPLKNT